LADRLKTASPSLQRELGSLSNAGILRKKRDGNRTYFQAESDSPLFDSLYELVNQTLGVVPALSEAISPFANKILCAFVYGSVAHAREHSLSDVDLLIVGSVGLAELAPVLRDLEKKFNRENRRHFHTKMRRRRTPDVISVISIFYFRRFKYSRKFFI